MGGSELHQALRSLCLNTDWNYAVFWKLKHQARMMLTCEDAYYDNSEQIYAWGNKWFNSMVANFPGKSLDPLALALAKMSYRVYYLGEGIVGEVAVTGKHLWISGDKYVTDSCSSFEQCDGLRAEFCAGIRTIFVVAVVPHGVVQLGSLNTIAEDVKLVNHVRGVFVELQSSLLGHVCGVLPCSLECSPCQSEVATRSSDSGNFRVCINNLDRSLETNKTNIWSPMLSSLGKPGDCSYLVELRGDCSSKTVEMNNKDQGPEYSLSGVVASGSLLLSVSENSQVEQQKRVLKRTVTDRVCEGEAHGSRDGDGGVGSKGNDNTSHDFRSKKLYSYDTLTADNFGRDISYSFSDLLDSAPCDDHNGVLSLPEPSSLQILEDSEKNLELEKEINNLGTLKTSFKFPGGCQLYEALGPAFRKQRTHCEWKMVTTETETETIIDMPAEGMSSSNLLESNSAF